MEQGIADHIATLNKENQKLKNCFSKTLQTSLEDIKDFNDNYYLNHFI